MDLERGTKAEARPARTWGRALLAASAVAFVWFATWGLAGAVVSFNRPFGVWPSEAQFGRAGFVSTAAVLVVATLALKFVPQRGFGAVLPLMLLTLAAASLFTAGNYSSRMLDADRRKMWAHIEPEIRLRMPGVLRSDWKWSEPCWSPRLGGKSTVGFIVSGGAKAAIAHLRKNLPTDWVEVSGEHSTWFLSPVVAGRQDAIQVQDGPPWQVLIELNSRSGFTSLLTENVVRLDGKPVAGKDRRRYCMPEK